MTYTHEDRGQLREERRANEAAAPGISGGDKEILEGYLEWGEGNPNQGVGSGHQPKSRSWSRAATSLYTLPNGKKRTEFIGSVVRREPDVVV